MVRVNLIKPLYLTDQHLVAEYNEILMLVAYIKSYPSLDDIPNEYCLGKGHMKFFKDKVKYLKLRHEALKVEMKHRGFVARKRILLKDFNHKNVKDWKSKKKDFRIIKKRLIEKIKLKPGYYRYYGKVRSQKFLLDLVKEA